MTDHRTAAVSLACVLGILCGIGCSRMVEQLPGAINSVVVTDAVSGRKIDYFLLVAVHLEGPEELLGPAAHVPRDPYRPVRAKIARMNSGDELRQDPIIRKQWATGGGMRTRFRDIQYYVIKDGYLEAGFDARMVLGFRRVGKPIQVNPVKENPGDPDSDRSVMVYAESYVMEILPLIPADDPYRSELISLVQRQVQRVIAAGRYRDAYPGALKAVEILRRLEKY